MSWSVSRAGLVTLLPVALPRNRGAHRWLIANRTVPDNVVAFFSADNPVAKQCCAFEVRNTYLSECIVDAMAKYVTRKPELYFIVFGESFRSVPAQSLLLLFPSSPYFSFIYNERWKVLRDKIRMTATFARCVKAIHTRCYAKKKECGSFWILLIFAKQHILILSHIARSTFIFLFFLQVINYFLNFEDIKKNELEEFRKISLN